MIVVLSTLALTLSACGGSDTISSVAVATPGGASAEGDESAAEATLTDEEMTLAAEATPTFVFPPTPIPAGHPDNPITLLIVAPESGRAQAEDVAVSLGELLSWYPFDPPEEAPVDEAPAEEAGEGEDEEAAPPEDEAEADATSEPLGEGEGADAEADTEPEAEDSGPQRPDTPPYTVQVRLVESYGEVINAMCDSEAPAVGWVDAWSYMLVEQLDCAVPRYMVKTGRGSRATTTATEETIIRNDTKWIGSRTGRVKTMGDMTLRDAVFCRLADPEAWRLPALMLMRGGVNPITDLETIVEYEDLEDMVRAIYEEDCIVASVPADWEDHVSRLKREFEDFEEVVVVMEEAETVSVPNPVMVYPRTVPLAVREHLNEALDAMFENDTGQGALKVLLDADGFVRTDATDFDDFREFVESAGLDMVAMGE